MLFFLSFLFCKIGVQEGRTCPGMGEVVGKRGRRVNMVQKCVHRHVNAKMIPVETVL
jgi:hypothetical protein